MAKAFKPYSTLWLTANEWYSNEKEWMEGPWESLDADTCEKFIEDRCRTIASATRYFKEQG